MTRLGYLTIYNRKGWAFLQSKGWYKLEYVSHDDRSITYRVLQVSKTPAIFFNDLKVARESGLKAFFEKSK